MEYEYVYVNLSQKKEEELCSEFKTSQEMQQSDFELYYYNDTTTVKTDFHIHDFYEIYFFMGGDVTMKIGRREYRLQTGDVVLIPPDLAHCAVVRNADRKAYQRMVFWLSEDYMREFQTQSEDYVYIVQYVQRTGNFVLHCDVSDFNAMQSRLFYILEELHRERFAKAEKIRNGVADVLLYFGTLLYNQEHPVSKADISAYFYEGVLNYIENHLEDNPSIEQIAKAFFTNKSTISRCFKENAGIGFHQYVLKKRLQACKNAIRSGNSMLEASERYGFQDYSSFYRAFKQEYGISPKEYRETLIWYIS